MIKNKEKNVTCGSCYHYSEVEKIDFKKTKKPIKEYGCRLGSTWHPMKNKNPCKHYFSDKKAANIAWGVFLVIIVFFVLGAIFL